MSRQFARDVVKAVRVAEDSSEPSNNRRRSASIGVDRRLTATECQVLAAIARHADREHNLVSTRVSVGQEAQLSDHAVGQAIPRLVASGWLSTANRRAGYANLTLFSVQIPQDVVASIGVVHKSLGVDRRRSSRTLIQGNNGDSESLSHRERGGVGEGTFTEIWNDHCAPLPRLRKPPQGRDAERLIGLAMDRSDGDLELLGRAIARAAANSHYRDQRYGWETFCRHIDRWLDDPPPATANVVVHQGAGPSPLEKQVLEREAREEREKREAGKK